MKLRAIQNSDLKVTKGWADTKNRQRVFVSLISASWVNKTYWLSEAEQARPETIARVKADLQRIAESKFNTLKALIES